MRKIAAQYVFPIESPAIRNGILVLDDDGSVLEVIDPKGFFNETASVEFYNGILVPGFVNAHCHLELSYLKNLGKFHGLPAFVKAILKNRNNIPEKLQSIIANADLEMHSEGIVAVGDIVNVDSSFRVKQKSTLHYETFIELFDFNNERTDQCINNGLKLVEEAKVLNLNAHLTPHAPYSVTPELFAYIQKYCEAQTGIYSLHNQESASENLIFSERKGELYDFMKGATVDFEKWSPKATSLQAYAHLLPKKSNILLIHNIFISKEDIEYLKELGLKVTFVLCPKSNLIIEDQLPNITLLKNSGFSIAIGTDSYASNTSLSVLDELKILKTHYSDISLEELFSWACLNGARALKIDDWSGSFSKGKKPGVNLITGLDFQKMTFTELSQVKKLA